MINLKRITRDSSSLVIPAVDRSYPFIFMAFEERFMILICKYIN